jgi:hypothetical protein
MDSWVSVGNVLSFRHEVSTLYVYTTGTAGLNYKAVYCKSRYIIYFLW